MNIVYRLSTSAGNSSVTLENCLFGAVKLTKKNADIDKYKYSGMVLDSIQKEVLHIQVEVMMKMLLSSDVILINLYMLITKQEVF